MKGWRTGGVVSTYACMNVGMYACIYECIYVCMYVRRYVGTVCMQVWMHRGEGYVCMAGKVARRPGYETSCRASGLCAGMESEFPRPNLPPDHVV